MSELETPRPRPIPDDDPIAHLHKMSTTAGVANSDYVAINTLAIASIVLGLIAAMAFVHPIFVLMGAAGIVCGLIAISQIRNSNGTQGGMWLAALGITLSLAFVGITGAQELAESRRERVQTQEVGQLIRDLARHVTAGDYASAYALFAPVFQERVSLQQFEQIWKAQQDPRFTGRLVRMEPNNIVEFTQLEGLAVGETRAIVQWEKLTQDSRLAVLARNEGQGWKISYLEIFDKLLRQTEAPKATFGPAGPPVPGAVPQQ